MRINWLYSFAVLGAVEAKLFEYKEGKPVDDQHDGYSISDIVNRHRTLTQTTRHEVEIFKNPKYDTSCIKKALDDILPKCLKVNIDQLDPDLRAKTAAKLSICEFEVAKISYPAECYPKRYFFSSDEDSIDYEDCILALEKSPQWWTSYSGNYRAIGDICFQESLPYEKDEILNLFLNVTEIYEKILEDLNESIDMSTSFKQSSKKSFEDLKKFMDEVLIKFQNDSDDQKAEYGQKLKDMNKILEETSNLTKILSNSTIGVTDIVINQIQALEDKWEGFFSQYNKDDFVNELVSMKDSFVQDIESRDFQINMIMDGFMLRLNEMSTLSNTNSQLAHELQDSLAKSLQDTNTFNEVIATTQNSIMSSSEYAHSMLAAFKELDEMNIGEILNVSEKELLNIFQRITDELNMELMKVHTSARTLDEELVVLVDKIGEATVSLVTINDLLTNNVLVKIVMFFAARVSFIINRIAIIGISVLVYYYLLVMKFKLIGKKFKTICILFLTSMFGVVLGVSIIKLVLFGLKTKQSNIV